MKRTSITKKILLNSGIIVALAIGMVLIGFLEFHKSKEFADHISPLTQQMAEFARLKGYYETFEHNLEAHFIIGGDTQKAGIYEIFYNLFISIESVKQGDYNRHLVEALENKSGSSLFHVGKSKSSLPAMR
jgi:hypothetical protein